MAKTVLITGAASGIGQATAEYFWQQGWNVAATRRRAVVDGEAPARPRLAHPMLDVTQPETITAAVQQTLAQFGRLDVVVNNAGYALMGPLEGVTPAQLEQQFRTNVFGLVATTQAVLPIFRRQGQGTIVNVASIGGRLAFPLASSYHATKWAVEGLSEALRYELGRFNVAVKLIEPGGIRTNFIHRGTVWADHPDYADQVAQVRLFSDRLNSRLPGPDGVARTIYRAACDRSGRLRYAPHGEAFLWLHRLLPDRAWRSLVAALMLGSRP
jgi:NAD(P)-dependent dehydrogenase (short-subunit alcohol dehydrogenase family)